MFFLRILVLCSLSTTAAAQDDSWEAIPGIRSADYAFAQWKLVSSTSVNSDGGGYGIYTFWGGTLPSEATDVRNVRAIFRCVDWFNASGQQTGGLCYQPRQGFGGEQ